MFAVVWVLELSVSVVAGALELEPSAPGEILNV